MPHTGAEIAGQMQFETPAITAIHVEYSGPDWGAENTHSLAVVMDCLVVGFCAQASRPSTHVCS